MLTPFLLVVEALSRGLRHILNSGILEGFSLPRGAISVSHLCFADDLIIFTRATRRSRRALFQFIAKYEDATGQKVNKTKSVFVVSKRCPVQQVRMIAHLTGIGQGSLPLRYLGCMLFKGRKTRANFQYIIEQINRKLMSWAGRHLSPGGRLILRKHVLSAIPIHVFAAMDPPLAILNDAEQIFSTFFWGLDDQGRRKRCWRAWPALTYPSEENGLGLRSLRDVVSAFSAKLWWKLQTGSGLWSRYVSSVTVAKSFSRRRLETIEPIMILNTRMLVLDGTSSFLHANWTGTGAICNILEAVPTALHATRICDLYGPNGWDSSTLNAHFPADIVQYISSFSFQLCNEQDRLVWQPNSSGLFTVSSAYEVLRLKRQVRPMLK